MLFRFSVFAILVSVAYADLIRKLQCTCQGGGYVHEIEYYLLEGPGQFLTIKDQCIAPLQKNCTIKDTWDKWYSLEAHGHTLKWYHGNRTTRDKWVLDAHEYPREPYRPRETTEDEVLVCDTLCSRSLDKDKQSDCGNLKDPHNTACRLETDYIPDSVALEAFLVEHDECRQERMRQNALPVYSDVLHNHELLPHDEL